MPERNDPETAFLRATISAMSTRTVPVCTPNSGPRLAVWAMWALAIIVLVGRAAVIDAGAAELALFDQGHAPAQFGEIDGERHASLA